MGASHSVRQHLRLDIDAYDEEIHRLIPGYDSMLAAAASAVAAISPELVLDLGAGTGALSAALLAHSEIGSVELIDVDSEMLERARSRLSRYTDRTSFRLCSFDDPFPRCDAMSASLSLHHIPTMGAKRTLYHRAFDALRPGGVFVNADCTMPADSTQRDVLYGEWVDHMATRGIKETEARQHFEDWSAEDTYMPLEEELAAFTIAGFEACPAWRAGPMTVIVGTKAGG